MLARMSPPAAPEQAFGSLREYAYRAIKEQILSGRLLPGAAISEAERAELLRISRSPVREALQLLAAEGLVEIVPRRGTFVARLSARDVRESFEFREAVEAACARLAAGRRTAAELARMAETLAQSGSEPDDYEVGAAFHALVVDAARNRYLQEVFEQGRSRVQWASRLVEHTTVRHTPSDTHEGILEAIAAGNALEAETRMRRHLQENARALIEKLL